MCLCEVNEKEPTPAAHAPVYETHQANWEGIGLVIRHCRSWLSDTGPIKTQHIEVRSEGSVPLPITQTGYRSMFLSGADALGDYGNDPVTYVLTYIREQAKGKDWQRYIDQQRQPDLFG